MLHDATFFYVFKIEFEHDAIQAAILNDRKSAQQNLVLQIIEADVFNIASANDKVSSGTHSERCEVLVLRWFLSSVSIILQSAAANVIFYT